MGVSPDDLSRLLARCRMDAMPAIDGVIPFLLPAGEDSHLATVEAGHKGGLVQFRTLELALAAEWRYRRVLFKALLTATNRYKLVKFGWVPSNGEVVVYLDVFVASGTMTDRQMRRCLLVFGGAVVEMKRRCERILATNRDPGPEEVPPLGLLELVARIGLDKHEPDPTGPKPPPKKSPGIAPKRPKKAGLDDLLDDLLR